MMTEHCYPSYDEVLADFRKKPKEPKLKEVLQSLEKKPQPQGLERTAIFEKYNKKLDLIWLKMIECENLPKHKSLKILKGYGLNE